MCDGDRPLSEFVEAIHGVRNFSGQQGPPCYGLRRAGDNDTWRLFASCTDEGRASRLRRAPAMAASEPPLCRSIGVRSAAKRQPVPPDQMSI